MFSLINGSHSYSFAATGISSIRSRSFVSRDAATRHMYAVMKKYNLQIKEIWNDNHHKTYLCNNGIRFYIQREF